VVIVACKSCNYYGGAQGKIPKLIDVERRNICREFYEQISRHYEFKRNKTVPERSGEGRGNNGSNEGKRGNEECAHCVSQNTKSALKGARTGLVRTLVKGLNVECSVRRFGLQILLHGHG
jgi:hypothetical protein